MENEGNFKDNVIIYRGRSFWIRILKNNVTVNQDNMSVIQMEDLFRFKTKNDSKFLKSMDKMEIKNINEESKQSERMYKEDIQDEIIS